MSFFQLNILSNNALEIAAAVFGSLGSVALVAALIPALLQVYKTKQTFGLSLKLLLFSILSGFCFAVVGVTLITGAVNVSLGSIMIASNLFSAFANLYLYDVKVKNVELAKKASMTEMDYYYSVVAIQTNAKDVPISSPTLENPEVPGFVPSSPFNPITPDLPPVSSSKPIAPSAPINPEVPPVSSSKPIAPASPTTPTKTELPPTSKPNVKPTEKTKAKTAK